MEEKAFNIPEFEYFDMGGKYSGNKRGAAQDDFNFRFTPDKESKTINAQVWYGLNCFDKSELVSESVFDKTREGYRAACDWVEEQLKIWLKDHKYLDPDTGYWTKPDDGIFSFNKRKNAERT